VRAAFLCVLARSRSHAGEAAFDCELPLPRLCAGRGAGALAHTLLSRGGCHNRWHSLADCDHRDSIVAEGLGRSPHPPPPRVRCAPDAPARTAPHCAVELESLFYSVEVDGNAQVGCAEFLEYHLRDLTVTVAQQPSSGPAEIYLDSGRGWMASPPEMFSLNLFSCAA
jgi:hypothetical protein